MNRVHRSGAPCTLKEFRSSWSSGTLTRYSYARGEFLGGGMPGDFKVDPSHTQLFTRVESVTTPNTMPEGIPNLTTKDVSIYDKHGHLVYSETRLLTANEG